jgi:SCY1-like protein 1
MASVVSLPGTPLPGARPPGPAAVLSSPDLTASAPPPVRARGMQLGAHKAPAGALAAEIAAEAAGDELPGGWGDGDLMDVNADEGDWSAFESAPAPRAARLASNFGFGADPDPSVDGACLVSRHSDMS